MQTNHLNYIGDDGKVFCKKLDKVIKIDFEKCSSCDYLFGSLQGEGVECIWPDLDSPTPFLHVHDPQAEYERVVKAIEAKIVAKG